MKHFPATDAEAYKVLARHWCSTVTVVTAKRRAERVHDTAPELDGFTATAFLTVSIDPPLVLVSAANHGSAAALLREADYFVVNLLDAAQQEVAAAFARPSSERSGNWEQFQWQLDSNGTPLLLGSMGAFSARITERLDAGDHTLVLGAVTEIHKGDAVTPLLYFKQGYTKPGNA